MTLPELIDALARAEAYPYPVEKVEVRQTHISAVFLAGAFAYKIKKPVHFSFVDFSTPEKRRYYCEREIALNRRLAAHVYCGVVPIASTGRGLTVEGSGPVVEWAVKMVRLPEEATLEWQIEHSQVQSQILIRVAQRIADFHRSAERNADIAAHATAQRIAELMRENLEVGQQQLGRTITYPVYARLRELSEKRWAELRPLFDDRACRQVPCDTHGDLRLEHIYILPERPPPQDITIIDCVEFNDAFRYADPVADMAFIVMDLLYENRRDLADAFAESYFQASGDAEGQRLLDWYAAYRAAVRGKVRSLLADEPEVSADYRQRATAEARRYWRLAWHLLEEPSRRPALVLVGGLPGVGKSTVARWLAEQANFVWLRSDQIRKELAGLAQGAKTSAEFEQGIYSPQWTERTYREMLQRAEAALADGRRVVVDATFGQATYRQQFRELALRWAVPFLFLLCESEPDTVRQRLEQRREDVSDANWSVYQKAAQRWQPLDPAILPQTITLRTDQPLPLVLEQVARTLRESALY